VCHGEGGDHPEHLDQRLAEIGNTAPAPCLMHQHRRQQQGEQEQDVVETDPDMPYAFHQILAESAQARCLTGCEALRGTLGREHGGLRRTVEVEAQEAAMQGIEIEQQAIVELQVAARGRTGAGEAQHRIGAVGVGVDQMIDNLKFAIPATLDGKAGQCPGSDIGMARTHLAPSDLAIAVAVEPEGEVDVAQGDVPLPRHLLALDIEHQVAVAGLVRQHRQRQQQ
jgi:hypothetical protein